MVLVAGATLVGIAAHRVALVLLRRHSEGEGSQGEIDWTDAFLEHCGRPIAWSLPVLSVYLVFPVAWPGAREEGPVGRIFAIGLIVLLAWLLTGVVRAGEAWVGSRFRVDVVDNLEARKVHTQAKIIRKILVAVIVVLAIGAILMTFEPLRQVGTGLLASAGLAGIVLGFAAQRTLGNLLAGIQIALTQPIRLDDVVIVEGEWGRIEEITLTYVVVRIWDLRRLVLPISWFIENPFQNWTRTSAELLGTVYLHVDYTVDMAAMRAELERVLAGSEHWNGEVWRMHVTDAKEGAVEVRCLMSADDSGTAWELRCEVREAMLAWLQRKYPGALPRLRAELRRMVEVEEGP